MPISDLQKDKLIRLGVKLKMARQQQKLTLKDLAYSIGKDPQSIHRLEMGKSTLRTSIY
jgi:DNA-binding XRE family transcriptional regulator